MFSDIPLKVRNFRHRLLVRKFPWKKNDACCGSLAGSTFGCQIFNIFSAKFRIIYFFNFLMFHYWVASQALKCYHCLKTRLNSFEVVFKFYQSKARVQMWPKHLNFFSKFDYFFQKKLEYYDRILSVEITFFWVVSNFLTKKTLPLIFWHKH
jgi:hypothetical protein